jgi:hypothetical protein
MKVAAGAGVDLRQIYPPRIRSHHLSNRQTLSLTARPEWRNEIPLPPATRVVGGGRGD